MPDELHREETTAEVVVHEYRDTPTYERYAQEMAELGWQVVDVTERQPRAGCLRIVTLGLWSLVFPPKPMLVVTYHHRGGSTRRRASAWGGWRLFFSVRTVRTGRLRRGLVPVRAVLGGRASSYATTVSASNACKSSKKAARSSVGGWGWSSDIIIMRRSLIIC